jgi:hypothetical protein
MEALGFTALGIRAGSLVASMQSIAMGGAFFWPLGTVVAASVSAATTIVTAAGFIFFEYEQAQDNTLGASDTVEALLKARDKCGWVLVWENWGHGVFFRTFDTREEAVDCSRGGLKLRRMIVKLTADGAMVENEHKQLNPWVEHHFGGQNVLVDNNLRSKLRKMLST